MRFRRIITGSWRKVIVVIFAMLSCALVPAIAHQDVPTKPPSVVYFHDENGDNAAWAQNLIATANAAATDFKIDLEIINTPSGPDAILRSIKERLDNGSRPDYVLLTNHRGELVATLEYLERNQIPSFVFNAGLSANEIKMVGHPREKFSYWLGQLLPNDEQAGYDLALALIERARTYKHTDRKIRFLAVTGSYSNPVAVARVKGMKRAIAENDDVEFLQVISAQWQRSVIKQKYPFVIQRYGIIDAVWAANDNMALGLIDMPTSVAPYTNAAAHLVLGGMDWGPETREALIEKNLDVSMGGHFIDVAFSMFLLKQHFDGNDFKETYGSVSFTSSLTPLMKETASLYDIDADATDRASLSFATDQELLSKFIADGKISVETFTAAQASAGGAR